MSLLTLKKNYIKSCFQFQANHS